MRGYRKTQKLVIGEAKAALMVNGLAYSGRHGNDGRQFTADLHQAHCGKPTTDRAAFRILQGRGDKS